MTIIRNSVLAAVLSMPIIASASTVTSLSSGSSTATPSSYTGTGQSFITAPIGGVSDIWQLKVGDGEIADITFTSNDLVNFGLKFFNIENYAVSPSATVSGLVASAVPYQFTVTGTSNGIGGGSYLVGTKVSTVPVPAAVWLMGSALVGLVSFGRRKAGSAA